MEWPSSLLTSQQIHFVFITYSSSSWNWPLSTAAVTGHLCPIIFKWLYFKHLWAKNIFSHSSRVKIICLESFSQMSISIFVLCWTVSNKSTMGFIHKNAQSWFLCYQKCEIFMLLCSKIDDFSQVLIKFEGKTYLLDRLKPRISKFCPRVLLYDSMPERQCNGNFRPSLLF